MSGFTKTLIVDADGVYTTIKAATDALITAGTGGTIIVERGMYTIGAGNEEVAWGSFDNPPPDPNPWGVEDNGWTFSGGVAQSAGTSKCLYQSLGFVNGKIYALKYQVTATSSGVHLYLKGTNRIPFGERELHAEIGVHVCYLKCINPLHPLSFQSDNTISLDNVSVRELTDTVIVPKDVTIQGQGGVKIVLTESVPAFINYGSVLFTKDSRIRIESFDIMVQFDGSSYSGLDQLYQSNVVHLVGLDDSVVENVSISCDQTVTNPQIYFGINPFFSGIAINHTAVLDPQYSMRNIIRNCRINNSGRSATLPIGTPPGVRNYYSLGILLAYNCYHTIVKNNYLTNSAGMKIGHQETLYSVVTNNICVNNKSTDPGIFDNVNFKYGVGILITSGYSTTSGNILTNEDPETAQGSHGIYPSSHALSVINANICCNNRHSGIKPAWKESVHTTICGNICYHNGFPEDQPGDIRGNGIQLNGRIDTSPNPGYPKYNIVCSNVCIDNYVAGIKTDTGCQNNNVSNNICFGNNTFEIDIHGDSSQYAIRADNNEG